MHWHTLSAANDTNFHELVKKSAQIREHLPRAQVPGIHGKTRRLYLELSNFA
jgi:hypothetical protein